MINTIIAILINIFIGGTVYNKTKELKEKK